MISKFILFMRKGKISVFETMMQDIILKYYFGTTTSDTSKFRL